MEAISNPLLEMADLEGIAAFARQHGLTHVIDNTFATPVLLRPASLGFIVIHSATKYLNGHSDVLAGVVSGPAAFIRTVRLSRCTMLPFFSLHSHLTHKSAPARRTTVALLITSGVAACVNVFLSILLHPLGPSRPTTNECVGKTCGAWRPSLVAHPMPGTCR